MLGSFSGQFSPDEDGRQANFGSGRGSRSARPALRGRPAPNKVTSMVHYVFAWQVAALLMGVALIPLLLARMRAGGAGLGGQTAFPAAFLVSDLLMLARTLLFSTIHYDQSARLGLFPATFEDGYLSGLIYLALVSSSAWALLLGLFRTTRSRGLAFIAPPYWSYTGLILAVFALVMADIGLPPLLRPLHSYMNLAIRPFVAIKLTVIAACAWLGLRWLTGKGSPRPALPLAAALSLASASQVGDIFFRIDNAQYGWAVPMTYLCYFGSLFVLALAGRKAEAVPAAAAAAGANGAVGGKAGPGGLALDLAGPWSEELGLDGGEATLLGLILGGRGNKQIAAELGIGLSAEKHRVQKLFRKLGVATRNEFFAMASERARRRG